MLNFMKLRDYPLDIDEFNHDVSSMVDRIYVGPQGELLSTLDYFNQFFGNYDYEQDEHFGANSICEAIYNFDIDEM